MEINKVKTAEEAINWINDLKSFGIKPGLDRMKWMLKHFNNPEKKLKFIHVAGTNGKGSTVSYLKNIMLEADYSVGTFTSPYLINFSERIQLNGKDIDGKYLVLFVNQIIPLVKESQNSEFGSPTEFEVLTLIAILYFAEISKPDIVIMETGLGGRLDSTNIIIPLISIITNIGYDHMNILGNDIKGIAREKAGIIKQNVPIISGIENKEALKEVKKISKMKTSPMYQINEQFFSDIHTLNQWGSKFDFISLNEAISDIQIDMIGLHQIKNATISIKAIKVLMEISEFSIDRSAIYKGMKKTFWPGRFEIMSREPLIIIDGAHNKEGAKCLRETLQLYQYRKLIMVIGILKDKAVSEYFETILPIVDNIIITEPQIERVAKIQDVRNVINDLNNEIDVLEEKDWHIAVNEAIKIATNDDLVIITGSLYLISDIRKYLLNILS